MKRWKHCSPLGVLSYCGCCAELKYPAGMFDVKFNELNDTSHILLFIPFFLFFFLAFMYFLGGDLSFSYTGTEDDEEQAMEFAQLLGSLFVCFLSLSLLLSSFFSFFLLLAPSRKLTFPSFECPAMKRKRGGERGGGGGSTCSFHLNVFKTGATVV